VDRSGEAQQAFSNDLSQIRSLAECGLGFEMELFHEAFA
jgi:hypothetical protein